MDRRGFFKLFGAAVAGIALEQAIPLGRVWSFPTNIVLPPRSGIVGECAGFDWVDEVTMVGSTAPIRIPVRYQLVPADFSRSS
jgi:hypothetical protein